MKRSTFLRTLAGSVRVGPQLGEAETPEEKEIYDLLDASVGGGGGGTINDTVFAGPAA